MARAVVRRPLRYGGLATLALLAMAVPVLWMHPQDAAVVDSLSRRVPTVDAAARMQQAFPGAPTPARVVIWDATGGSVHDNPNLPAAVERLRTRIAGNPGLLAEPVTVVPVDEVLVVRVPLAGSGTDAASNRALVALRDDVLPATLGQADELDYAVMGRTAFAHDFAERMTGRAPVVFGFVLLLGFLLLATAFRSVAVALVSIWLNLLSIGAAYGALTWAFQDGHLASVLDFTPYGGVVGWLPMFMFVLLFGLSMDYHIFVLSRIQESQAAGLDAREAIVAGVACSAGVVTSAAAIMTSVFSVFLMLGSIEYKMLGFGMAVAVLIDATVVRGVLLPAALAMLTRRPGRTGQARSVAEAGVRNRPGSRPGGQR